MNKTRQKLNQNQIKTGPQQDLKLNKNKKWIKIRLKQEKTK